MKPISLEKSNFFTFLLLFFCIFHEIVVKDVAAVSEELVLVFNYVYNTTEVAL